MALFDALRHGQYIGASAETPRLTNLANYIQFIPKEPHAIEGASELGKGTYQHRTGMAMYNQQLIEIQALKRAVKSNRSMANYEENTSQYAQLVGKENQLKRNQMNYINGAEIVKEEVDKRAEQIMGSNASNRIVIDEDGNSMVDVRKINLGDGVSDVLFGDNQIPIVPEAHAEQRITSYLMSRKDKNGEPIYTEREAREEASWQIANSYTTYNDQINVLDEFTGYGANGMPMFSKEHPMTLGTGSKPYDDAVSGLISIAGDYSRSIEKEYPLKSSDPYHMYGAVFVNDSFTTFKKETKTNAVNLKAGLNALLTNTNFDVERSLKEEYLNRIGQSRLDLTGFTFNPLQQIPIKDTNGNIVEYELGFNTDEKDPSNYFNFHTKFVTDENGNYLMNEKDDNGNIIGTKIYNPEEDDISDIKIQYKTSAEKQNDFQTWKGLKVTQDVMPNLTLAEVDVDKTKTNRTGVSRGNEEEELKYNATQAAIAETIPSRNIKLPFHGMNNGQSDEINYPNVKILSNTALGRELRYNQEKTITGDKINPVTIDGKRTGLVFMNLGHGLSAVDADVLNTEKGLGGTVITTDGSLYSNMPIVTNSELRETINGKFSDNFLTDDMVPVIADLAEKVEALSLYDSRPEVRFVKNMLDVMLNLDPKNITDDAFNVLMDDVIKSNEDKDHRYSAPGSLINPDGSFNFHTLISIGRKIDGAHGNGSSIYEGLMGDLVDEMQLISSVADMSGPLVNNQPNSTKTGIISGIGESADSEYTYYYKFDNSFLNLFEVKTGTNDDDTKFDINSLYSKTAIDERLGNRSQTGVDISVPAKYKKIYVLYDEEQRMEISKKSIFVNKGGNLTESVHDVNYAIGNGKGRGNASNEIKKMWLTNLNDLSLSNDEINKLNIPTKAKGNKFDEDLKLANGYYITEMYVPVTMDSGTHTGKDKYRDMDDPY